MASPVLTYAVTQARNLDANSAATSLPKDILLEATRLSVEEHNAEMAIAANLFTSPTTYRQTELDEWADAELQPIDELSEPQPIKGKQVVQLGFPIDDMGVRFDLTFKAREQMTVKEYSDRIGQIQHADANTFAHKLLSSFFANASLSHKEPSYAAQTIKFLANGDGDTYATNAGGSATTATNQIAQAAAIADATNPFPTIESKLVDRRINRPPYVVFVAPGLVASIKGLDGFVSSQGGVVVTNPALATSVLTSTLASQGVTLSASMMEFGGIGQLHLVQWNRLPAGYMIYAALGDPERRPFRLRQYAEPSLQGLVMVPETNDFPAYKNRFLRFYGIGGYNRVGGGSVLIGNATYSIPSGFTTPFGRA